MQLNLWNESELPKATLTSSPGAFPVNRFHVLENSRAETTADTFGLPLPIPFAILDRSTLCWKTSQTSYQLSEGESLETRLGTWPAAGMMRNGESYRREPLVQLKSEKGSLWSPTLTASEWKGVSKKRFLGSPEYRADKLASYFRRSANDLTHLNPDYAEVYMGFPMGWTELDHSETR